MFTDEDTLSFLRTYGLTELQDADTDALVSALIRFAEQVTGMPTGERNKLRAAVIEQVPAASWTVACQTYDMPDAGELIDLVLATYGQPSESDTESPNGIHSAAYKKEFPAESRLPFKTAVDIGNETVDEVPYVAKPWVAIGSITEISGKPKSGGKTTFTLRLCGAVVRGSTFLNEATRKTSIVYLTEERSTTFREALKRADLLAAEDFVVLFWRDTWGFRWEHVIDEAIAECKRRAAELLIVDTIAQFAQFPGDSENTSGHVLEIYKPLQKAAGERLGVVVIRHERKAGGDVSMAGRGSTAFTGAADIIMSIRRPEGNVRSSIREIHAISRFNETPDELAIELTESGYVALGESAAVAQIEATAALIDVAPSSGRDALTLDALADAAKIRRTTAQEAVQALEAQGKLRRIGDGKKGSPYRYYKAATHSAGTDTHTAAETIVTTISPIHGRRASFAREDMAD